MYVLIFGEELLALHGHRLYQYHLAAVAIEIEALKERFLLMKKKHEKEVKGL